MAPVLRLGPVGTHVSPLGANPLLHTHTPLWSDELSGQAVTHELPPGLTFLFPLHASQTPFALQWEQSVTWQSKHLLPALLGLLVCVVHVRHLSVVDSLVHVAQSAMPLLVSSLQEAHIFVLSVVVVGK